MCEENNPYKNTGLIQSFVKFQLGKCSADSKTTVLWQSPDSNLKVLQMHPFKSIQISIIMVL